MSKSLANLLLLLAGAVWGMGFIAQETAMDDIGPFGFTGLRFILAGIVVLPIAIWEQRRVERRLKGRDFLIFLPLGCVFFLALVLQQIGLVTTSVTNAGFLTALYVIIVPILLLLLFRQQQSAMIWPAALLALAGIFLLSGGELSAFVTGDWLVIVGAFFGAVHVIMIGKLAKENGNPFTIACVQFFVSGVLGMIGYFIAPVFGVVEVSMNADIVLAALPEIVYAGVFSGALAFSLMAYAQQFSDSASAAILLSSESLFAALFAAIILGERLVPTAYFGCGLIFAALLLVELAPRLTKLADKQREY